jgi:hypothetical protein
MQIVFTGIRQETFADGNGDVSVLLSYTLPGPHPDFVECYATNAAGMGLGVLVDTFDVSLSENDYARSIRLRAGSYYTIGLCPRTGSEDSPDQEIDGSYWESYCVYATLITQAQSQPTPQPPQPPPESPDPGPPVKARAVPFRKILLTWDHTWSEPAIVRLLNHFTPGEGVALPNQPPPLNGRLVDTGPFIFGSTYTYWVYFYRNPTDYRSISNDVVYPTWLGLRAFLPSNFDPGQGIKRLLPNDHPYVSVRKIMSGY